MRAVLLGRGDPSWTAFVGDTVHDFYHLPGYVDLCARHEGAASGALLVADSGRRLLVPLLLRQVTGELRDAISPYGYPGPLLAGTSDPEFLEQALAHGAEALARMGIVSVFVRGHPVIGPALDGTRWTVVNHGPTVSVDLQRPAEELWRHTMSGHRGEINKAIRAGHRAFADERFEQLGTFGGIYRRTMERLHASSAYLFADSYFADLRDALGPRLHLWLVDIGGEIAAGGLFVETCGLVQYHLSGTDPRFAHERPTKLMLHRVREWAKAQGFRRLHLGGGVGAAEDSLYRFKAGFATDRHVFQTLRMVCDERAYAELVRATHPHDDPANRSAFFPLYRKPA